MTWKEKDWKIGDRRQRYVDDMESFVSHKTAQQKASTMEEVLNNQVGIVTQQVDISQSLSLATLKLP